MMNRKFQSILAKTELILLVVGGFVMLAACFPTAGDQRMELSTSDLNITTAMVATVVVERPLPTLPAPIIGIEKEVVEERPLATDTAETPPTDTWDTADKPETDPDKIFAQVKTLIELYDANIVGQSGWFYHRYEDYMPDEILHSNTGFIDGFPEEQLYPDETMIGEEWYFVDVVGDYQQKIGYTTDREGVIRRGWAITNGKFVNLPYARVNPEGISDLPPLLSITLGEVTVNFFEDILNVPNSSVQAWREGNTYIVFLDYNESPHTVDNIEDFNKTGGQLKYWFDLTSGAIQQHESVLRGADGRLLVSERVTYLERQYVTELPLEAAQLLEEAAKLVQEMD